MYTDQSQMFLSLQQDSQGNDSISYWSWLLFKLKGKQIFYRKPHPSFSPSFSGLPLQKKVYSPSMMLP